MHIVVVRIVVKPGFEEAFAERVQRQAIDSMQVEAECRQFDVCRDGNDRRRFFLYEVYTNAAAFDAHLRTTHFIAFNDDTREWVDEKAVERWERNAGLPAKS